MAVLTVGRFATILTSTQSNSGEWDYAYPSISLDGRELRHVHLPYRPWLRQEASPVATGDTGRDLGVALLGVDHLSHKLKAARCGLPKM